MNVRNTVPDRLGSGSQQMSLLRNSRNGGKTMETKKNIANTVILIVIFAGVFLYNIINPSDMVEVYVESDVLVIAGLENVTYRIPVDTVDRFYYLEEMEYPEEAKSILCGTYSNETLGEYVLYVNGKIDACIVAETENGTYVFNYENASTTKSLCEALEELI